jgi:hypothetical protein
MAERERQPWERCRGESGKAFAAFRLYLGLGVGRSVQAAWLQFCEATRSAGEEQAPRKTQNAPGHWTNWSTRWGWVERADAHDDHQYALAEEARENAYIAQRLADDEEEKKQAKTRVGNLVAGRSFSSVYLRKLYRSFLTPAEGGTGELVNMPPEKMLQHVAKVGSLLVACIAEERRERAAMAVGGEKSADAAKASESVQELARELLAEIDRERSGPGLLTVAALAEEYSEGGSNGNGHSGSDA